MIKRAWINAGKASKGIIIISGATLTALYPYEGHSEWYVGLVAGLAALNAILIPNQ